MEPYVLTAKNIATEAHRGQKDKAGSEYIGHPARVVQHALRAGADSRIVAAAWLHDVLEDTEVTAADLRANGIPEPVIEAVQAVTKIQGEPAERYYERVGANPLARAVKAADLRDNTDPARLALLPKELRERLTSKYAKARMLLGL